MRISDWSSDVCSSDLEAVAYPWHPTPQALAAACDTLIAILPGNAATRHIVDAAVLEALGPDGVFVNVARGSVVDGQALASALEDGTLLAAGLDVFADEPTVPPAQIGGASCRGKGGRNV